MELWGWLIAYVVAFGLVQLLLYQYFQHRRPTPESATAATAGSGGAGASASVADVGAVCCEECGSRNEGHRMIRYCRDCIATLQ